MELVCGCSCEREGFLLDPSIIMQLHDVYIHIHVHFKEGVRKLISVVYIVVLCLDGWALRWV